VRLYQSRDRFQKFLGQVAASMSQGPAADAMMDYTTIRQDDLELRNHVEQSCYGEMLNKHNLANKITRSTGFHSCSDSSSDSSSNDLSTLESDCSSKDLSDSSSNANANSGSRFRCCPTRARRPKGKDVDLEEETYREVPTKREASQLRYDLLQAEEDFEIEHVACMSSPAYYFCRVQPLLQMYMKERPGIARLDMCWTIMLLLLTTIATVLASLEMQIWVPIIYALAAFLKTIQDYSLWSARQGAMARAISDLKGLQAFWSSLSPVDKGLPQTRNRLVKVTEAAVLSVFNAGTGGQQALSTFNTSQENSTEPAKKEQKASDRKSVLVKKE